MVVKLHYGWGWFEEGAAQLVQQIRDGGKEYSNIYGVPRGGLVLAVVLSHHLRLPLVLHEEEIGHKTLVVDDISDFGHTLKELTARRGTKFDTATLQTTNWTEFPPTYSWQKKPENTWSVFSWEWKGEN